MKRDHATLTVPIFQICLDCRYRNNYCQWALWSGKKFQKVSGTNSLYYLDLVHREVEGVGAGAVRDYIEYAPPFETCVLAAPPTAFLHYYKWAPSRAIARIYLIYSSGIFLY
jgi:hypothetical protein